MRLDLVVDGARHEADVPGERDLLSVLRDECGVAAPKDACREGQCGACSVLLDGLLVCACLVPAAQAGDASVTTAAGLGAAGRPHRVQEALARAGAVQCGFCTPGISVAAADLVTRRPGATRREVAAALAGNLCRCTGYVKILDAVAAAAGEPE